MLFFVWFDDNPKKLASEKLQEAIAAYIVRFNTSPIWYSSMRSSSWNGAMSWCAMSVLCNLIPTGWGMKIKSICRWRETALARRRFAA